MAKCWGRKKYHYRAYFVESYVLKCNMSVCRANAYLDAIRVVRKRIKYISQRGTLMGGGAKKAIFNTNLLLFKQHKVH